MISFDYLPKKKRDRPIVSKKTLSLSNDPDLSEAQVYLDQDTGKITIANVILEDGSTHDVVLQWRKATQGFEIVEVLEFVVD